MKSFYNHEEEEDKIRLEPKTDQENKKEVP